MFRWFIIYDCENQSPRENRKNSERGKANTCKGASLPGMKPFCFLSVSVFSKQSSSCVGTLASKAATLATGHPETRVAGHFRQEADWRDGDLRPG